MLLKAMNFLAGIFGYEWVKDLSKDTSIYNPGVEDEGWDDIYDNNPKFKLKKLTRPGNSK